MFVLFFSLCYLLLGFEKDNKKDYRNCLLIMMICVLAYYIFIYIFGLFTGFLISGYSLKLSSLITNIFPVILFQGCKEMLRYEINTKGERKKSIILLSVIIFVLADIYSIIYLYDIGNLADLFEIVELYLLPFIAENILMTYTSLKAGYKANIVYELVMKLPVYIIPIVPDLGDYLDVVFRLLFPCLLLYYLIKDAKAFKVRGFEKTKQESKLSKISFGATVCLLAVVIYLTSGLFTYYAITIGSESMQPKLDKGDITIVKKTKDYESIKVGDILVYEKENRVVVHRVTSVDNEYGRYVYTTKGDANNAKDGYFIYQEEVIGIVKFKIKYLGYPTIWLNEIMK